MAVVERFKKESVYGMSAKKVAFVETWPLVQVRLYIFFAVNSVLDTYPSFG